jgi:DNA primase large subunit
MQTSVKAAIERLQKRKEQSGNYEIFRRDKPIPIEAWPPCMKNILEKCVSEKGPHRGCAVLAAFLYRGIAAVKKER